MKPFRLLAFALVFASALRAEQKAPVTGAPFEMIVPAGWVRIPDEAMERLQLHIPGVVVNNIAGFIDPRSPPNTPMTVLLVQAVEGEITPKAYLDFSRARLAVDQAESPGAKVVQDESRIGIGEQAVITSFHTSDGRVWRIYAFPTADRIFEFSLHCSAVGGSVAFAAVESCLSRLRFVAGSTPDAKWIAELKKVLPPATKRAY